MNIEVNFTLAKLLKEKEFEGNYSYFYTSPNSKMFGIDEHHRHYPIINTPKKLYTLGENVALNIENVYPAPTIAEVVMWIYKKYNIWISVDLDLSNTQMFDYEIQKKHFLKLSEKHFESPTLAYNAAIEYVLTNLIK